MKKNVQKILATILTVVMMVSMLPFNVFAADFDADMFVEPAVEAVSVPAEEQEIESAVEEVPVAADEIAEDISVEDAETVNGYAEEFETVDAADPAAADEIEETTEAPVAKTTLEAEGKDYVVSVTYDASALLPDDVKVVVKEIKDTAKKYDDYCDQALEAVQQENADVDELSYVRLFDIKLVDAAGNILEPASAVDVQIRLKDVETVEDNTQIVHFAGEEEIPEVIEPTVEDDTVSFATDGFSIYAVIGTGDYKRLTVNFYGTDLENPIDTLWVKEADKTNGQLDSIIYDPGVGTLGDRYAFYGWSIDDPDYEVADCVNAEGEPIGKTIDGEDGVREYIRNLEFTDGQVLNIYAMLLTYYRVDYLDGDGISLGSDRALVKAAGIEADYIVNKGYSADESTHHFEGWLPIEGVDNITDPEGVTNETLFKNETPIKIKGDVKFSVSAPEGNWLIFDENGKYATYNAPRFIYTGAVPSDPEPEGGDVPGSLLEMTRKGYVFAGWYTGAPEEGSEDPTGETFDFSKPLTGTTTAYAKWTKNSTATYTVIIWKEGLEEGTYDFGEAVTIENAAVDQPVAVSKSGNFGADDAYAIVNGENKIYKGFHLKSYDQNVTVGPEGNTVVNVYYDRTVYTLTFKRDIDVFGIVLNSIEYGSITARYGTYIGDQFPITGNLLYAALQRTLGNIPLLGRIVNAILSEANTYYRWMPTNSNEYTKVTVYLDTMPAENIIFERDTEITSKLDLYYYGESLDGSGYELLSHTTARYNFFSEAEDFNEIIGFEKDHTDPPFDANGELHGRDSMSFYYTRRRSKITYLNGWLYDGNDARYEDIDGEIAQSVDIAFGTNISSYNKDQADYFVPPTDKTPEGYVFAGWYVDEYCTKEFNFTTMPANGITVYAKWHQIQYRVFLNPQAGRDPSLDWGSENQQMNFRVSYGGKISAPEGTRTGYKFYGWHKDPAGNIPVYLEGLELNETTVTEDYDKTIDLTDPTNKWGQLDATSNADVDRFWITKKFTLYGSWGKVTTGADGIGIIYDVNGSYDVVTDNVLYQDNTSAVAAQAPPAIDGKVFKGWAVQKWNGVAFEDSGVVVLPGRNFKVLVDDAKIVIAGSDPEEIVTPRYVEQHTNGSYEYTVHVKAVYEDKPVTVPTHITWYTNYASDDPVYRNDTTGANGKPLKINEAVSVYGLGDGENIPERLGYNFLGWAKDTERVNATDSANITTSKTEADFLVYNDGEYYLPTDTAYANAITEVAADELTPYEGLYAIWELKPEFYIYHSGTGEVDTIDNSTPIEEFDITDYVDDDFIYGGYYRCSVEVEDGEVTGVTRGKPYIKNGMKMKPVSGTTYYLKEVDPNTYLVPSVYATWLDPAVSESGALRGLWILTDVDEIEYDGEDTYREFGIDITGKNTANMPFSQSYNTLEVKKNGAAYQTLTTSSIFGADGYFGVANVSKYATLKANQNAVLTLTAYHVTPDNIKVTGTRQKTYNMGNQTLSGVTVSETTIKSKKTQEYLQDVTTSTAMTYKGTYQIKSEPEIRKYTITKVDDGKNVSQEVEAGDNTGKITYAGKNNYVFAGWYLDKSFTKAADFSEVSGDMTVYAKYVKASAFALSFTKKSSKTGSVTLKATLKITGAPNLADTAVTCGFKGETSSVKFTDVKTTKSGKNTINTHTGTVAISGLANKNSFTAVISYRTPDGTTVSLAEKTCKYVSGAVTVK